jgi:hypothetical protein
VARNSFWIWLRVGVYSGSACGFTTWLDCVPAKFFYDFAGGFLDAAMMHGNELPQ